jgi:hypothetical protein
VITVQMTTPWNICSPVLFRHIADEQFVDAFFADGSIRLSSFGRFRSHEDEQRLDKAEGDTNFLHRTNQGGGQSIFVTARYGHNAYMLSTSTRTGPELRAKFGQYYIRISDPTQFGIALSKHVPGLLSGFEGGCLYQQTKTIERDLGYIDPKQFEDNQGKAKEKELWDFINTNMQHWPYFLKHGRFAEESEYRFVWLTRAVASPTLDIKVPEAIQFCERANAVTE